MQSSHPLSISVPFVLAISIFGLLNLVGRKPEVSSTTCQIDDQTSLSVSFVGPICAAISVISLSTMSKKRTFGQSSAVPSSVVPCGLILAALWLSIGFSLVYGPTFHGIIGIPSRHLFWDGMSFDNCFEKFPQVSQLSVALAKMAPAVLSPLLAAAPLYRHITCSGLLVFTICWSMFIYYPASHALLNIPHTLSIKPDDSLGLFPSFVAPGVSALFATWFVSKRRGAKPSSWMRKDERSTTQMSALAVFSFCICAQILSQASVVSEPKIGLWFAMFVFATLGGSLSSVILSLTTQQQPSLSEISLGSVACAVSISPLVLSDSLASSPLQFFFFYGVCVGLLHSLYNRFVWKKGDLDVFGLFCAPAIFGIFVSALFSSKSVASLIGQFGATQVTLAWSCVVTGTLLLIVRKFEVPVELLYSKGNADNSPISIRYKAPTAHQAYLAPKRIDFARSSSEENFETCQSNMDTEGCSDGSLTPVDSMLTFDELTMPIDMDENLPLLGIGDRVENVEPANAEAVVLKINF